MKFRIAIILICGLMIFPQTMPSQISASTTLATETVGYVFDSLTKGVDRVIQRAFDRLDMTLLNAAMKARAIINAAKTQFDDSLVKSIDQLDGQQRRLIENLKTLNTALHANISDVSKEFREGINHAMTNVRLLVSKNPGAIYVAAKPVIHGDDFFDIEIKGTALSKAQLNKFSVSDSPVKPERVHADDRQIVYRVKMDQVKQLDVLKHDVIDKPVELPVTLSFLEKSWFPSWLSRIFGSSQSRGPFSTTALILPKTLGEIRAVFSASKQGIVRRRQTRGPFHSARVKTTIKKHKYLPIPKISRGRRTDIWSATPSDGWKIDPETAEFDFRLLFSSCWSRESTATWIEQTEHILKVRVYISAENLPGKTCKATTNISFEEWRELQVEKEIETSFTSLPAGDTVVLKLPPGNYKKARLAHIQIRSPLFRKKNQIYRIDRLPPYLSADYDHAAQSVYVKAKYLR